MMRSDNMWSLLVPYPIVTYYKKHDLHVCYWNGTLLTRSLASTIVAAEFFNIPVSRRRFQLLCNEMNELYEHTFLQDMFSKKISEVLKSMDSPVFEGKPMYLFYTVKSEICREPDFINNLIETTDHSECLSWFLKEKIIVVDE